jgi:hypothetical protein
MQLCCPVCSTEFPLEAGLADVDAKRLAALLAETEPALARALFAYLRLHKPAKTALRATRALKLLQEVLDLVGANTVTRDRRTQATTPAMWITAIEQMVNSREKLRLPLSGHGYLLEVVAGVADQAAADAERRAEEDKRLGRHRNAAATGSQGARAELATEQGYARQMRELGGWTQEQHDEYIRKARARLGVEA